LHFHRTGVPAKFIGEEGCGLLMRKRADRSRTEVALPAEQAECAVRIELGLAHLGQAALGKEGRILVRPSGTEPVVRVMGEGPREETVKEVVEEAAKVIQQELN
jgi:phosphomannomutase